MQGIEELKNMCDEAYFREKISFDLIQLEKMDIMNTSVRVIVYSTILKTLKEKKKETTSIVLRKKNGKKSL